MPYVSRDGQGKVIGIFSDPSPQASEFLPANAPELDQVLSSGAAAGDPQRRLLETDPGMARVLEDLIEALVEKNVIMFTDLPEAARVKLMSRRRLRGQLARLIGLVADEGDL